MVGIGILLMTGPIIGFLFTIYAMMPAFAGLQVATSAGSDELSRRIGLSMTVSMCGFGAAVAGSALLAVAVVALGNRSLRVYRYGIPLSIVMCLAFGAFGVIFGVGLILILAVRRNEFLPKTIKSQDVTPNV